MVHRSSSVVAENAESMSVIDHDSGVIFLCKVSYHWQVREISCHREHPIDDYQFWSIGLGKLELLFKRDHIIMGELENLALGQARPIYDTGVIVRIQEQISFVKTKKADYAKVYLESSTEGHGIFFANEFGKFLLQSHMNIERAIQKTRS